MKVLIADKLPPASISALRAAGHDTIVEVMDGAILRETLAMVSPDVLVVRSTTVDRAALLACPTLSLVVRAGAGYDSIDTAAASALGIFVANCPGKNAHAVAELTIGLMVSLDRRIPEGVQAAREGRWDKARFARARGFAGRTLGVIGLGPIGRLVAQMALGMNMHVVAWSRSLTTQRAKELGVIWAPTPEEAAAVSDVVTLHVAAHANTRHLAGRSFFEAMKPGAYFINTTRSSVVDEDALAWALETKGMRAALDVCSGEPRYKQGTFSWPLAQHEGVYVTHHIGASTVQAQEATANEAVQIIKTFAEEGVVRNCVNVMLHPAATHLLTVRHRDRVGVLAAILDIVRSANINVQEMENLCFAGQDAAGCALIRLSGKPDEALIGRIEAQEHVFAASLTTL